MGLLSFKTLINRKPCFTISSLIFCLIVFGWFIVNPLLGRDSQVLLIDIKGGIGPAVSDHVRQGLKKAHDMGASLVILRMDTPGGLDLAMRDIIKAILSSLVPVVTYVAPDGARAASAGTYILYASHVAAMAPATNVGAATPVSIGGFPGLPQKPDKPGKNEKKEEKDAPATVMERKMLNDAAAFIESLAERHGRNSDWAVKAVREAVSLTAKEALKIGVIDMVATDMDDLLQQVHDQEVMLSSGKIRIIMVNPVVSYFEQGWRNRLLSVISDPNIAYLLLLLGIYGLIFELAHPGYLVPGIVGGISLLLALYTIQILPINYAGLGLIILGIIFMVSEAFIPSFGALGIGGIVAFVIGSFILIDEESLKISVPLIVGSTLFSAGLILWVMGRLYGIRHKPVRTGMDALIGSIGEAMDDFNGNGWVVVHGESWRAHSQDTIKKGQKVRVKSKEGLRLIVENIEKGD